MSFLRWCLGLVAVVVAGGCAPKPEWGGPVSGAVTFEGKPLKSGAVTFVGATGHARNAEIVDGKYQIDAPPFGECKITVLTAPEVDETGKVKPGGGYVELPARYAKANDSGLAFTVTEQPQTHDLKLTK